MLRPATALGAFVECEHLAWLERQVVLGRAGRPGGIDAAARLLFDKGRAHERAWLDRLRAGGREVVEIEGRGERAAAATLEAMRRGAPAIYQGVLHADGWIGIPDFLERVESPASELGPWSYEVADAKLARRTKPTFLLQLCLYGEQLASLQGVPPARMHVLLGTREREPFLTSEFAAYFRRLRARYLRATADDSPAGQPLPVPFCGLCSWITRCEAEWERADHLCRVADIRRTQIARLSAAGIGTLAALATSDEDGPKVARMARPTLDTLRRQARLQRAQAEDGRPRYELLAPRAGRGFALLPEPSRGDVFFDMEGDPYVEGGLEYLFGATTLEGGMPSYHAWWAEDGESEQKAFEDFVDFVVARRRRHPDLHVYHYAAYEPTALKRLAGRFGSREEELDDLLRGEVLVDLYRVVKQGIAISQPGYSIKKLEVFYRAAGRSGGVVDAAQSIVAYERWIDTQEEEILGQIEAYNEDDCLSTLELRDWLRARRLELPAEAVAAAEAEAALKTEAIARKQAERDAAAARDVDRADREALAAELLDPGAPETPATIARVLLGRLLQYHRREARPAWWSFFARCGMTEEELLDDNESIAGLEPDPGTPPRTQDRSTVHAFRFPPQEFKLKPGTVLDPATGESTGDLVSVDALHGRLLLKRGPKVGLKPIPRALIPPGPYDTSAQQRALWRVAADVRERGIDATDRYRALRDLLLRLPPRVRGRAAGDPLLPGDAEVTEDPAADLVGRLDGGALFIQGPPGSGKTTLGARLIVRELAAGRRVGVTATGHRAIHHLLEEVERVARDTGVKFRGLKKATGDDEDTIFTSPVGNPQIESRDLRKGETLDGYDLVAGTAWLLARPDLDQALDVLFVDEAGQVALADAIAVGTSARNLVLLGDPQQLAQVSQGAHPDGAGASVLEHLLAGRATVPPDAGLFLSQTWRMHPDVCAFVSEAIYDGRLHAAAGRDRQAIVAPDALSGTGLRFAAVPHAGNSQSSVEEAVWIGARIREVLVGTFVDHEGVEHRLTAKDILVVAPYNAQVRCLVEHVPEGVAVGTVDKFQGQQAPIVFYSMATSSGEEMPRGVDFLFSKNRLNVAISRARALAVLVASPRLLDVAGKDADQMRLVNALCRFVEMATEV